jgi:hypothetical protein
MEDIGEPDIPDSIAFYDPVIDESVVNKLAEQYRNDLVSYAIKRWQADVDNRNEIDKLCMELSELFRRGEGRKFAEKFNELVPTEDLHIHPILNFQERMLRDLAGLYSNRYGCKVVPMYSSQTVFEQSFGTGEFQTYQIVMDQLPLLDETIEWAQIVDFRADNLACYQVRALRTWMQDAIKGRSASEATDIIHNKLKDYEDALKKHGLTTLIGALKTILPVAGGSTLVGLLHGPIWPAIVGGSLMVGQISLWAAEKWIERESVAKGANSEVALIHSVYKKFAQTKGAQRND